MQNPFKHLVQAFYYLSVRSSKPREVVKSDDEEILGVLRLKSSPSWNHLQRYTNLVYACERSNALYQLDQPTLGICFPDSSFGLEISSTEVGECSNSASQKFSCEICVEEKPVDDLFEVQGCTHCYCTDCTTQYIISKLDQSITWIKCPVENCEGFLGAEHCRSILPNEVYERWGKALCDSFVLGSEKLMYCPFKDCSGILIKEGDEVAREIDCPYCLRLFCGQCESPWHSEMECKEFQGLLKKGIDREDIMLIKLAEKEMWKRCPSCKFYVQKESGCQNIRCRCGVVFCYSCGKQRTTSQHCLCFVSTN